ncbi:Peptidyl-prolyl cis-trans isomerase-like 3 [Papilio xuthus]|uniref:peptidylprolyl isomerase n=1 Tax=Papilio xuthus TaxID=66420 RepID=A0A194PQ40_PAPXU|nr:Peptidyl-prolyl cis-trans isomerase-like 3 [Papilio xuthus]
MSVTIHTDVGDIKIELFCEQCPKACENFLALCASDYYNGCLFHRNIKHNSRGIVSMANNGPNTNGSQFFFTYGEQPHLDLKYTTFGRIIDGFEALDDLEKLAVNPKTFKPLTEVRITSVTIHANPLAG